MEKLLSYPQPDENPNCLCMQGGGGLSAAFFCQMGHMTECHSGMSCSDARCSHLPRYDETGEFDQYEIENAPAWSVKGFVGGNEAFSLDVFAPGYAAAQQIVEEWISQTENLSKFSIAYEVSRKADVLTEVVS
jgi:hypothetical protein